MLFLKQFFKHILSYKETNVKSCGMRFPYIFENRRFTLKLFGNILKSGAKIQGYLKVIYKKNLVFWPLKY